jgi:hypothetical protein
LPAGGGGEPGAVEDDDAPEADADDTGADQLPERPVDSDPGQTKFFSHALLPGWQPDGGSRA